MPRVSVVIPVYNRAHVIGQALDSVLGQTYRDLEAIVVDDGSIDSLEDTLTPYLATGRVRLVKAGSCPSGPAAARNAGIRAAGGALVALLDSDDLWLPIKLEAQVAVMDANREVGLCYGNLLNYDPQAGRLQLRYTKASQLRSGDLYRPLVYRKLLCHASTWLVRRACFERVGLFDPLLLRSEERELSIRLARHYPFHAIRAPLAIMRLHSAAIPDAAPAPLEVFRACDFAIVARVLADDPSLSRERHSIAARYHTVWARKYLRGGNRSLAARELWQILKAVPCAACRVPRGIVAGRPASFAPGTRHRPPLRGGAPHGTGTERP
jgi:glycosyltransferase involved in cell wall biosynthesis